MLTAPLVKERATLLGFDLCGIAPACDLDELARLPHWLARGFGGRMTYLNRTARVRADVRRWLSSARSVTVVANLYNTDHPHHVEMADPSRARIARYAWGDDYHDVMKAMLERLAARLRDEAGPFEGRSYVDTGPIAEKAWAAAAGIGAWGKNGCLLHPEHGSWFFLGELVTDLDLPGDAPRADLCGTCTACLEACPTGALVAPYVLGATRCISYLTIEVKGSLPEGKREGLGRHVFGCDICQDVCPFNAVAPLAGDLCWQPRAALVDARLEPLWTSDDAGLERAIDGTALRRAGVRGLRRNLAVAIGNAGPPLTSVLDAGTVPGTMSDGTGLDDARPSVRDAMVAEHIDDADGEVLREATVGELLPGAFTPTDLPRP